MILSLQGCMAVGKTTAARYLEENAPYLHISYEENADVLQAVRQRHLDKTKFEDYIEIQKLWLNHEIERGEKAKSYPYSVMDFGAEEIEFYTLCYPKTIGENWDVKRALEQELAALQKCMPSHILFLDAGEETLRRHKEQDATRTREFFAYYLQNLLPQKRAWFYGKSNVEVLMVDSLDPQQLGIRVKEWCDRCIAKKR